MILRSLINISALTLFLLATTTGCLPKNIKPSAFQLKGDTSCDWGDRNCNRCVINAPSQLDRIEKSYRQANRIRFDGYAYPSSGHLLHRIDGGDADWGNYEHIQSIGRISGIGNNEYMVFTHSTESDKKNINGALAVVRIGASQQSNGGPFGNIPYGDGANQNTSNRTVARAYAGNNHPGGISVLGHYVYVAQWCQGHGDDYDWCKKPGGNIHTRGFSVYDVRNIHRNTNINSNPPIHRYYKDVTGENWINKDSTASVAAVKLKGALYLVALSRTGGKEYGFYLSSSPTGPFVFLNSASNNHKGENANFVTECGTGDIYMFQIEALNNNSVDKVHLYKLHRTNGGINFQPIMTRQFTCRGGRIDGAGDWCHFDAGAGTYITPNGNLILYATDWHQSNGGNIRIIEFY